MNNSETKFVTAGRAGKFQVTNWEALTGIGRFDAILDPGTNQLSVTFKVCLEFSDHDQQWRDDEKLRWEPRAFQIVQNFWSDRFRFQVQREGWTSRSVAVDINIVPTTMANAHLHLRVSKLPPDWGTSGGGVGWSGLNGSGVPFCNVDNMSIEPKDQRSLREAIFNLRLFEITQALRDRNVGVIEFPADSADIPPAVKVRLAEYARYVHRVATPDVTGIEIWVYGSTGTGDSFFQTGLGLRRAKAVKDFLNTVIKDPTMVHCTSQSSKKTGLKRAIQESLSAANGAPTTSTKVRGTCIIPHVPANVDRAAEQNYIVLCHEFGHMLGLPDEYMGRLHPKLTERVNMDQFIQENLQLAMKSGDPAEWTDSQKRIQDQQAGVAEMLRYNPDVKTPTFMDQSQFINNTQVASNSIMYAGMEVMPAHYLTLWSCLAEMTWNFMDPTHWKIVPSPAHREAVRYF